MPVGANAGIGGLNVGVGVDLSAFNAGMQQVENRGKQVASSLNSLGSAVGMGAGMGVGIAAVNTALSGVSSLASAAGSAIVGLNSQLEQARIGFTAFTGSVEKSNQFVKQLQQFAATTTFEFPGLLQMSRSLVGMGVAAESVIPMLKTVSSVVMGMGGGEVEIKRVNKALTQMIATGRVQADEMNQLAEAGIPAWQMLADSLGVSIGKARQMSKQGEISAQDMLKAFQDFANNNNLSEVAEKAGQTWQAATSNIIDGLRNVAAEGFEPLFALMRDGAVALANWLVSDQVQQFGADLKATMADIVSSMKPVQDAVTRIWDAFKTQGATGAFDQLLTEVGNLAQSMFGAGVNVVAEYARGLMEGAGSLIVEAANFIADTIASYLIGQSPPPVGPLSDIAAGGTAVIQAYVDGMAQGLTGIENIAVQVQDALGNVDFAMTLEHGRSALLAAGTNLKALEATANDVEGAIRTIDDALQQNQSNLRDYQNAVTDIKDAYEAAIEPLQAQVDALKETNDLAQKQADIQTKIQLAQLKGQLKAAQGDPAQRAKLESQLDEVNAAQQQLQLQEKQLSLNTQSARLAAQARGEKYKDTSNDQAKNALAQRRLQLEQQEAQIRQQINGLEDKGAIARIKTQQAQVQAVADQRDLNQEIDNLQRQLAAAPLETQIKNLQNEQRALIAPIQERIKETQREGEALQEQRKQWQGLKADITDVMQQQRAMAAEAKKQQQDAAKATKDAIGNEKVDVGAIFGTQKIDEAATKVGQSFAKGISDWLHANGPQLIGGALGTVLGGAAFGPLGAIAGGIFGQAFVKRMQENFGSVEQLLGGIAGKISDALNIDTGKATNAGEAFAIIWETVKGRVQTAIDDIVKKIAELTGTDISSATTNAEKLGLVWENVQTKVTTAIDEIKKALTPVADEINRQWQSIVDTVNSSEFKDNLSTIAKNMSIVLNALKTDADNTKVSLEGVSNFTIGGAIQSATRDIALLSTAFVNLLDTIATVDRRYAMWLQTFSDVGRQITLIAKAISMAIAGDWEGAQAAYNERLSIDQQIKERGQLADKEMQELLARIKARTAEANAAGKAVIEGVANGAAQATPQLEAAMTTAGEATVSSYGASMDIQSPSGVMIPMGVAVVEGLVQGVTTSTPLIVAAITEQCAAMLVEYTAGWTAIHEGTQTQLDEIYTLIQQKFTDIVGLVPIMMQQMLQQFATGFSAIHTQMGGQLTEIHGLIMMQTEQWRSAGLALGNALAEGIAAAQLNVQRSGMTLMSSGGAASGSKASPQMEQLINEMAKKYGLDARLFMAQLQHESAGFDPNVLTGKRKGGAGEVGVGQFLPSTLRGLGVDLDAYLKDVNLQVETAAKYLSDLVKQYGDIDKALMAYNGGPGGVGSAATQRYVQIVRGVADTLKAQNATSGTLMSAGGGAGRMSMGTNQIQAGMAAGLSMAEAQAICGPYAAVLFAQATGKTPSLAEAKELAVASGWTAARGMGGTGNFMSLLGRMGINAVRQAATAGNVNAALGAGNPVAFSTPKHYFVGSGGTAEGGINVGATGTVMPGGKSVMTLAEIEAIGGGMNDLIVLTQKLETTGTQTFNSLTTVTGQFGTALNEGVTEADQQLTESGKAGEAAAAQMTATTQTLTQSIQSGIVPAGLAARDAVGGMAVGIQPLIATWAQGGMTSNQLAESIVQLAAQTGLATQPLAQFAAGNVSVGEALRQVMTQLALTDPAFAAIQQEFAGAQLSTEQLADVLLRGLANVTGRVGPALQQIASAATPLQTAFSTGAISGEQFAQSVVQLAATSGLTQAPLRQMQDGVLTTSQALAQVVSQVAETNPELATLAENIQAGNVPLEEGAKQFLEWSKAQAEAQKTTTEATESIQVIPEAVVDIQAPMESAATDTMQVLPTATTEALNASVDAIRNIQGPATSAATEVGKAIVEAMRTAIMDAAESLAEAAQAVVEKALEAAKKAAEKVKESAGGKGGDGDGDKGEERAKGGKLTPGVWTLVGERGPELISPGGYVYNAQDTTSMLLGGIASGLFTLNKFADGGQMFETQASKSKKPKKPEKEDKPEKPDTGSSTPKKQTTEPYKEELDLEQRILELTQKKNIEILKGLPVEEALRLTKRAQEAAAKGTLEQQLKIAESSRMIANVDAAIAKIRFDDSNGQQSMFMMEKKLGEEKKQQERRAKGDLATRLQLVALDQKRLAGELEMAKINAEAAPARNKLAELQERQAEHQRGTVDSQVQVYNLGVKQKENQVKINNLQIQAMPLQQEEAKLQKEIEKTLNGTAAQRQQIAEYAAQIAVQDMLSAQNQAKLLPIQKQITDYQRQIDDITKGTLDDQYKQVDLETQTAQLRLQEIDINNKLRNVAAGKLNMSQEEINNLHKQLENIELQKADIQDTTELKELQAQIATADMRKQVIGLQEQEKLHTRTAEDIEYQKSLLSNQTSQIQTQNAVSATGQQARLASVQEQLATFTDQIAELEAQNQVMGLQVSNIQLGNELKEEALGREIITLQAQVLEYDKQVAAVQRQNTLVQAQTTLIQANLAVQAAGNQAAITAQEYALELRQDELDALESEKTYLQGQITLINTQNTASAAMYNGNLVLLEAQKKKQDEILEDMNAQIAALNAQKAIYEDIRKLADQIANRPPNPTPAPTPGAPGGHQGPPGNVVATASKNNEPTLYLSRGSGTDGWYTSDGRLIVQGGSANPPSGYRVRWLASGGTWHAGEVAVLGENGAELAIAKRDMHVFPHEQSKRIADAFGSTASSGGNERNVTVNVEYHRHSGTDYGEATLQQVVREAVNYALRA